MKPRVIWLDDDIHDAKLRGTIALFRRAFDIIECENLDEFRKKSKLYEWDAAILDVLNSDEKPTDVISSIRIIGEGKLWFVYSGKPQITQSDNLIKDILEGPDYARSYASLPIYEKSTHDQLLIEDITNAVKNKRVWQVENQYEKVLKIVDTYLEDKECHKYLLDILCAASGATELDSHLYYNKIRVILEWMFRAANKAGLLHDNCFDSQNRINLTDASMFMAGKPAIHSGVICEKAHFPVLIANNVRTILEVTGGASHTTIVDENERPNLTTYWANIDTPYLLYSLAFMLCDILVWFGQYVEEHPDIPANTILWRELRLEGNIQQDEGRNYFVGDCLIPYSRMKGFALDDYIVVTDYEETDSKSQVPYPLTAKRLRKLE